MLNKCRFWVFTFSFFLSIISFSQVIGENAYFLGHYVNVGIDGDLGLEGTDVVPGCHNRTWDGLKIGFTADPNETDWDTTLFHGDFFLPGTPENGFGLEFGGSHYSNNYNINDINSIAPISYETDGGCSKITWRGAVSGLEMVIVYGLKEYDKYYTTEISLINTTDSNLTDVYYYRNVDPDNNQMIGGGFPTTNTIVSQPDSTCQKALVSASQNYPIDSYMAFGAIGMNWRVSYGGFSNRSASNIWDDTGSLTHIVGSTVHADQAISLAYKDNIPAGDTINFKFAVLLSEDALGDVFSESFNLNYLTLDGATTGFTGDCENVVADTVVICQGSPVRLFVEGDAVDSYEWIWSPELGLDVFIGDSVIATPDVQTTYTVSASGDDCLTLNDQFIVINPIDLGGAISDDVTIEYGGMAVLEASGGDEYEWFPIDGLSDPASALTEASPTETTQYFVAFSSEDDMYDCIDTLSVWVNVLPDVSDVKELEDGVGFAIFPNPFVDYTTINLSSELSGQIEYVIYDVLGQEVVKDKLAERETVITRGTLKPGVYMLKVFNTINDTSLTKKLVVK